MDDLKSKFINIDNFYSAFKKLNQYLKESNEWYNPIELSEYEANLATNLNRLKNSVENGTYKPHSIEPLPFPKKNNKNNEERLRQYFRINIEDQLVLAKKYGVKKLPTLIYFKDGKPIKEYVGIKTSQELLDSSKKDFK